MREIGGTRDVRDTTDEECERDKICKRGGCHGCKTDDRDKPRRTRDTRDA